MKILFVWDVAGVGCVQAKYLRKLGHECDVIMRRSHDDFNFIEFYGETYCDMDGPEFDSFAIMKSEYYDVIHVNSDFELAHRIKKHNPSKKVVLEYHGSDCRNTPFVKRNMWERPLDKILVSTPDLLDYGEDYEWMPITVDTEHFTPSTHIPGALFIKPHDQDVPQLSFPFKIIDRDFTPIQYRNMPKLFEKYHLYVDVRYDMIHGLVKPLSKTALEALSTGMKVYNSDGLIIQNLPECFKPETVSLKLECEYKQLCQ